MVAVARTTANHSTMSAATGTGHVFVSADANAAAAKDVTYTRIDSTSTAAPNRSVSRSVIDPLNRTAHGSPTPATTRTPDDAGRCPGRLNSHVAYRNINGHRQRHRPARRSAGDRMARDAQTGTLYVLTDFTVLADSPRRTAIRRQLVAGRRRTPQVEVAGRDDRSEDAHALRGDHGRSARPPLSGRPSPIRGRRRAALGGPSSFRGAAGRRYPFGFAIVR